jgi:B9 domain-containing protein 1
LSLLWCAHSLPAYRLVQLPEHDNLYCKFAVAHGQDWSVIAVRPCIACIFNLQGVEEGITQQSTKTSILSGGDAATPPVNVWNFPLDIAFRSTNAFGWPQIIVSVYGTDLLGRDVVRGYGCVHFPRVPGTYADSIHPSIY